MREYVIKIDGHFYCGDGNENETQIPPPSSGFHHSDKGISGIKTSHKFADARVIKSFMNIRSHMDKILRCVDPLVIEITDCSENHRCAHPLMFECKCGRRLCSVCGEMLTTKPEEE